MLLGTVLEKISNEAFALETVVRLGDFTLLSRLRSTAEAHDLTLGQAVTAAINGFNARADADSWLQLMSTINRADDPGGAALKLMLEVSLPRQ